ncbi:hypothetical protein, partial [Chryseobacterium culicis]|uniref:hypothetical protein n=1 Tax=Chryseobacterium culicis TaxID=680127 RepID=UPI001E2B2AE3
SYTPALPVIGTAKIITIFKTTTLFSKNLKVFFSLSYEVSSCLCLSKSSPALTDQLSFSVGQR